MSQSHEVDCRHGAESPPHEELLEAVAGAEALICTLDEKIDAEVIEAGRGLKVIGTMAVGFNNIDIEAATRHRIPVCHTPDVLTEATADLTWALILAAARRVPEGERLVRAGEFKGWAPEFMLGGDLHGRTLGILGMGRIGRAVARRASGFEMTLLYYQRTPLLPEEEAALNARHVTLEALLSQSDILSLHCPLTAETHHLIDGAALSRMRKSAYLINTARGPVVDEEALARALSAGDIAGAGLDVYEEEPEVHLELLKLDNVVLLPHLGSATRCTRDKMAVMIAEDILSALNGDRPRHMINPEVWRERGQ